MTGEHGADRLTQLSAEGWAMPPGLSPRRRPTQIVPWSRPVAVRVHRLRRHLAWWRSRHRWTVRPPDGSPEPVHRIKEHRSPLRRQFPGEDARLQGNKVINLALAAPAFDGLIIRPGQTFSFCRTLGNATRRKGYVEGMVMAGGRPRAGVGGGLCQLANVLHWLILHSPMTVIERHTHGVDVFPDDGRVVPWATGCTIAYNYIDLMVRNDTDLTFGLGLTIEPDHVHGVLRSDRPPPARYEVYATDEEFFTARGRTFRKNQVRRRVIDPGTGERIGDELIGRNLAIVTYPVPTTEITGIATTAG